VCVAKQVFRIQCFSKANGLANSKGLLPIVIVLHLNKSSLMKVLLLSRTWSNYFNFWKLRRCVETSQSFWL